MNVRVLSPSICIEWPKSHLSLYSMNLMDLQWQASQNNPCPKGKILHVVGMGLPTVTLEVYHQIPSL